MDPPVHVIFHWKTERPYQNRLISALTRVGRWLWECFLSYPVKNEVSGGYMGSLHHLASVQYNFHLKYTCNERAFPPFISWWKCQNIGCSHSILNYLSKEHPVPTIFYTMASHQDKFMQEQTGNKAGPKKRRRTDETKKIHAVYNRKHGKWERCQMIVRGNTSNYREKQNDVVERKKESSTWRWKTKGSSQLSPWSHLFLYPLPTEVCSWSSWELLTVSVFMSWYTQWFHHLSPPTFSAGYPAHSHIPYAWISHV